MKASPNIIVLKLGGACNLHCKHCHCFQSSYKLNEDIFPYIRQFDLIRLTFCGGEPLMYYDTIQRVVSELPGCMAYKFVTNGTLLTSEMVDYFNKHNFKVFFSYDGENDSRDHSYLQCWEELAKLKQKGHAVLFSQDNRDGVKLFNEVTEIRRKYKLRGDGASIWANFVHQTVKNPDEEVDKEVAKDYCSFMAGQIETDMRKYKAGITYGNGALETSFNMWVRKHKNRRGIKCFNENIYTLTLDGRFLLCPYEDTYVGDIYSGVDWDKIESFIPEKCKKCPIWDSCGNACIVNVTDNDCYVAKVMHKHILKLMDKYDLKYEELAEAFKEERPKRMNFIERGLYKVKKIFAKE